MKKLILEYRFISLFLSVIAGIFLAKYLYQPICEFITNACQTSSVNSLLVALIALPTTAILWFLRTHDTRENIHQNDLFDALKMLTDNMLIRREIATQRLIDLAEKVPEYKKDIKLSFIKVLKSFPKKTTTVNGQSDESERRGYAQYILRWLSDKYTADKLDLNGCIFDLQNFTIAKNKPDFFKLFSEGNFKKISFNSADLTEVNLATANLQYADFTKTTLANTDLSGANLQNTNFSKALIFDKINLQGANLSDADLENENFMYDDINLEKAKYSTRTKFPEGFKPGKEEDRNMILVKEGLDDLFD
jgi:hypothetical protein